MRTNLDRLHDVVLGNITGRGAGHTVAHCHEIASVIELGETDVALMLPRMDWIKHVLPVLDKVLQERGVGALHPISHSRFTAGHATITVISAKQPGALAGRRGVGVEVLG
jgi:late competence protein required for DNA uptake (superfamily II DNA/RNA helicase)